MSKKSPKSKSEAVELKSFFYPRLGLSGATIKAATKEEADAKAAEIMNPKAAAVDEKTTGEMLDDF